MGKIAQWFGFEEPDASFSQPTVPIPDGYVVNADVPDAARLFNANRKVDREQAMRISAVAKGRNAIVQQLSTLPLLTYDKDNNLRKNVFISQLTAGMPNVVVKSWLLDDLIFEGRAYLVVDLVTARKGLPVKAHYVSALKVQENDGEYWIDSKKVDPGSVIKFTSPNKPMLEVMSDTLERIVLLLDTYEGYARNPKPQVVVRPARGERVQKDAMRGVVQGIKDASVVNAGLVGVSENIELDSVAPWNPAELQLLEMLQQAYIEIANFFGLEPAEVGVPVKSDTYKNLQERRIAFKTEVLGPYAAAIEERLSLEDVTPTDFIVRFNYDEFLRADAKERAEVGAIERQNGFTTQDEYRASKGLPPLTSEQKAELAQEDGGSDGS